MGRPKGSRNKKGGRYIAKSGYVFIKAPEYPNVDMRGYVREHILIMSRKLGRTIDKNEIVHHKNGNRTDNREENLEIMYRGRHTSLHHKGKIKPNSLKNLRPMTSEWGKAIWDSGVKDRLRKQHRTCDFCGASFIKDRLIGKTFKSKPIVQNHQFCNRRCFQWHRKFKGHLPHPPNM